MFQTLKQNVNVGFFMKIKINQTELLLYTEFIYIVEQQA